MKNSLTVIPAYGRDYKNQKEVLLDWNGGKDFIIKDISSGHDGWMINKQDAGHLGVKYVQIRYDGCRKIMITDSRGKGLIESIVSVNVRLIIRSGKDADINKVVNKMNYDFVSKTKGAEIIDTDIQEYGIVECGRESGKN